MRKLTSWEFRKCCRFWVLKVLNLSYWLSKSGQIGRKKFHGKLKIGRVLFFYASLFSIYFNQTVCTTWSARLGCEPSRRRASFFGLLHLWQPITPVQNLTPPIGSTFSERSGRELSHGPILDILWHCQCRVGWGTWLGPVHSKEGWKIRWSFL